MRTPATLSGDLLAIYLNDHLAASTGGLELARRTARSNRDTDFGPPLADIARELEADQAELIAVMRRLGRAPDRLKVGAARLLERAGRLKLNGRLRGYSPLSRVIELESLVGGVEGKLALWRMLRIIAPHHAELDEGRLDGLIARGRQQQSRLIELHRRATEIAFID